MKNSTITVFFVLLQIKHSMFVVSKAWSFKVPFYFFLIKLTSLIKKRFFMTALLKYYY